MTDLTRSQDPSCNATCVMQAPTLLANVRKRDLHSQNEKSHSGLAKLAFQGLCPSIYQPLRLQTQPLKGFSVHSVMTSLTSRTQMYFELNLLQLSEDHSVAVLKCLFA